MATALNPGFLRSARSRDDGVLTKAADPGQAARLTAFFLALSDRTHFDEGAVARLRRRQAGSEMLRDQPVDVVLQLLVEVAIELRGEEQRSQPQAEPGDPTHGRCILCRFTSPSRERVPSSRCATLMANVAYLSY